MSNGKGLDGVFEQLRKLEFLAEMEPAQVEDLLSYLTAEERDELNLLLEQVTSAIATTPVAKQNRG